VRFLPDGTTEIKIHGFFFQLDELEPEQKERLTASCREAIINHWVNCTNRRGHAYHRSLCASEAVNSYYAEIRELNRSHAPRSCPFEFREIAGERLRFHHPSGEVTIRIGNTYFRPGDIPADRLGEINRGVFMAIENYLRDWRP
jgi:hypothetical protein